MKKTDILIVGGSAAGVTTAMTARSFHPDADITLVRKEENVLIPWDIPYILGTVGVSEKNYIPDAVLEKINVKLVVDKAVSIDREAGTVITSDSEPIGYEKMVLTTGSLPLVPPLLGFELDNVSPVQKDVGHLRDLSDTLKKAKDVVIIGGGFVGVEFADACKKMGDLNVTVIELLPHCLLVVYDEPLCVQAEATLAKRGVEVFTNCRAEAILGDGKVEYVQLQGGKKLKADVVILGIGVAPNVELAEKAGLQVDRRGGIFVDEFMRTSDPKIFAAGDCAQKRCYFTGRPYPLRLASIATVEARTAAANLFRLRRRNTGAIGIFATKIGDLALMSAGMTERMARKAGFETVTGESSAPDMHPGCMSEASDLAVKLVFEKETGVIIGGQAYGGATTGEAINFIGAVIQQKARADEIAGFQMGTHPALTASPIAYPSVAAAEDALGKMRRN